MGGAPGCTTLTRDEEENRKKLTAILARGGPDHLDRQRQGRPLVRPGRRGHHHGRVGGPHPGQDPDGQLPNPRALARLGQQPAPVDGDRPPLRAHPHQAGRRAALEADRVQARPHPRVGPAEPPGSRAGGPDDHPALDLRRRPAQRTRPWARSSPGPAPSAACSRTSACPASWAAWTSSTTRPTPSPGSGARSSPRGGSTYHDSPKSAVELLQLAKDRRLVTFAYAARSDHAERVRFGKSLGGLRDRRFGDQQCRHGDGHAPEDPGLPPGAGSKRSYCRERNPSFRKKMRGVAGCRAGFNFAKPRKITARAALIWSICGVLRGVLYTP